jgi:hypothetical protein
MPKTLHPCPSCECRNTLDLKGVTASEVGTEITDRWLDAEIRWTPGALLPRAQLRGAFLSWCKAQGVIAPDMSLVYARLRLLGHEEAKVGGVRYFRGMEVSATVVPPTVEAAAETT